MNRLLALLATCCAALALGAAPAFPPYVTLPVRILADDATYENFGQHEFTLREKTEVHRGRHWTAYANYAEKMGDDPRRALASFVEAMKKGGWEVLLQDAPRNPPLATLHYTKNGKDAWAEVEIGEQAGIRVIESGPASAKLELAPPAKGGEKVAA